MNYIIEGYEPKALFEYFEKISAIPRGSGNESGIADFLCRFADKRKLYCYRDKLNNVFIKMPGSCGREAEPALLLQGHTDMVCEKNSDTVHDFEHDPLSLYIENGSLRARGTTLGGDDGIAVAAMLAVLDGEISDHPPIECLFTVMEEVGLDGAKGFDYSQITARRMINLDSEEEGHIIAGCAGGMISSLTFCAIPTAFEGYAMKISVRGLAGGHSGENINDGRANANKIMGSVLSSLSKHIKINLVSVNGGSKDNAIPRECTALIACDDRCAVSDGVAELERQLKKEMSAADSGFSVSCCDAEQPSVMFDRKTSENFIGLIGEVRNGVMRMSDKIDGLVEFSRNLGVISTSENEINVVFSSRSAKDSQIDESAKELDGWALKSGCTVRHYARYPGWDYTETSELRSICADAVKTVLGRPAEVNVIHAGLECGIISSHLPDMDMVSIGPDIKDIHSPDEKLDLASCERFWKILEIVVKKR